MAQAPSRMVVNAGYFRYPSGQVYDPDGKIYRGIFGSGVRDFETTRDVGVYDSLIDAGLSIRHVEVVMKKRKGYIGYSSIYSPSRVKT